jgi:hypothetical protein
MIKADSNYHVKLIATVMMTAALFLFNHSALSADYSNKLSRYKKLKMYGWRIFISNDVVKDNSLYRKITKQVNLDLQAIIQKVPEWSLSHLRETPIFFEKQLPPPLGNNFFFNGSKGMSAKYNIEHTYGGVIAGSTLAYIAVKDIHPWQLLHELTHAYHRFTTKHSYKPIQDAYQNAIQKGLHNRGNQYARKNNNEYFSTLTEAYFGRDANYPHNRKELAEHDPIGYCAIVKAWGIVGKQEGTPPLLCK